MKDICGYRWMAPLVLPGLPSTMNAEQLQICVQDKDHQDDHRSWSNVTTPNTKEQANG